ncbi:hypothetical protein FYK55_11070 [Roseiconus nitratireducens]|uniref:Peptidase C14 caspase domain-containing protein n=1 Tax=Roseiconus nitratireducens TaxID=2605748 RepID=A0A5M6D8P6_9BACT|nr:caspase family protein [Roseiconus nitratireducens]KAA5543723.1 hypothetical protein FYK55_11070 [Roseiconus nitratireducens]
MNSRLVDRKECVVATGDVYHGNDNPKSTHRTRHALMLCLNTHERLENCQRSRCAVRRGADRFLSAVRRIAGVGWCTTACLMFVMASCVGPLAVAQLPPESQLPTDQPPDLPAESTLPDTDPPSGTDQVAPVELPAETELPRHQDDVLTDTDPSGVDRAAPGSTGPLRPILRLDYEGHTALIRALTLSADGQYLVSAGDDKDVHVWRSDPRDANRRVHERTIRWQVARGPRGRIYALACKDQTLAFAGHGAMGATGEIWVVDVASGKLLRPLVDFENGHRQVVQSLVWAPGDRNQLASQDLDGQVMLWEEDPASGLWAGRTLFAVDAQTYGADTADRLKPFRGFVPLSYRGPDELIRASLDRIDREQDQDVAKWKLQRVDLISGKTRLLPESEFSGTVNLIQATEDGRCLIAGDRSGLVSVWKFDDRGTVVSAQRLQPGGTPLCAAIAPDGGRVFLGTALAGVVNGRRVARLQCWDLQGDVPTFRSERLLNHAIASCVFRPQQNLVTVAVGQGVESFAVDDAGQIASTPVQHLDAPASRIAKVAFADGEPYRIAVTREPSLNQSPDDAAAPTDIFDLAEISLRSTREDQDRWLPAQRLPESWTIKREWIDGVPRYRLFCDDQPRGVLPLSIDTHGAPTAIATIDGGEDGAAVVIGTNGRNNLYVFAADDQDPPQLLRQYRGHTADVRSLQASSDRRYLVSGSSDATVCLWNLQGFLTASPLVNRWGLELDVDQQSLVASSVREDGPLYFRGVRQGDQLVGISWSDSQNQLREASGPELVLERLRTLPFDTLVTFRFSRFGRPRPSFQSFPAWRPLATLLIDRDREWAFWTPAGYYDASFNGHQRFGWQINRGVELLPDFFRAAQFRKALERPDVMRRLLRAGSLPAAMRESLAGTKPPPGDRRIVQQYLTKPRIELISPESGTTLRGETVTVTAAISAPLGTRLVAPKAFLSGVPAIKRQPIERVTDAASGAVKHTYRWRFDLPSDPQLRLEIVAATDAEAVDRVSFAFPREAPTAPPRQPRLHVLALGIGNYRDPRIQSLDFATDSTTAVTEAFRHHSGDLYQVSTEQLSEQDATRSLWRIFARAAVERLSEEISPDDLVVMYLCGHGLRDRRTNQWYFVAADADFRDLMNDQYRDCLSFDDLSLLASLPCRKLAIIDSCHSGAIQPLMRDDDLKSVLRLLQQDLVLTLTASEGDEEAAEVREAGLGRFTQRLVEALEGAADQNDDQVVSLSEAVAFVTRTVAEDSEREGRSQHPTASPDDLLRHLELPLTSTER